MSEFENSCSRQVNLADYDFDLPASLIAQYPTAPRSASRLMVIGSHGCRFHECRFRELTDHVAEGDLLVFNDTRVIPARLAGRKRTENAGRSRSQGSGGGRIEILIEEVPDAHRALVRTRSSKPLRPGAWVDFGPNFAARCVARDEAVWELEFNRPVADVLDAVGLVPLPPYIRRPPEASDRERYQTIFSRVDGAIAAPTAALHFDRALVRALSARGVRTAFVTLHVGPGTFQPVRARDARGHRMHEERAQVPRETVDAILQTRARRRRVVAVGTTTVRALESAALPGGIAPFSGRTGLFILPGHRFRAIDALITNFHLPRSTLLLMVSAFAGRERVMAAYREAISRSFRFYSYGDAMFFTGPPGSRHDPA